MKELLDSLWNAPANEVEGAINQFMLDVIIVLAITIAVSIVLIRTGLLERGMKWLFRL